MILDSKEVATRLMNEIINIEKMNDNNFYVNLELETLKELRLSIIVLQIKR
jgi:hypothetical protein